MDKYLYIQSPVLGKAVKKVFDLLNLSKEWKITDVEVFNLQKRPKIIYTIENRKIALGLAKRALKYSVKVFGLSERQKNIILIRFINKGFGHSWHDYSGEYLLSELHSLTPGNDDKKLSIAEWAQTVKNLDYDLSEDDKKIEWLIDKNKECQTSNVRERINQGKLYRTVSKNLETTLREKWQC